MRFHYIKGWQQKIFGNLWVRKKNFYKQHMLNFDISPLATLGKGVNVREDGRAGKILIKSTVLLTCSSIFNEIVQMSDPQCISRPIAK